MRQVVQPVRERDDSPMEGFVETHPAYAQVQANRVSGSITLYGSEFRHQNYMTIRVMGSKMRRSLANDWPHAAMLPYIEIALSEAQWAHFVSSPNTGSGSLCTLQYRDGHVVPGLPDPEAKRDRFAQESDEAVQQAKQTLEQLSEAIATCGLSQAKQRDLQAFVAKALRDISSTQSFIADQFGEHMEKTTEAAKTEIDGYLMATLQSLGVEAISGMRNTVLIDNKDPS